MAMRWGIPTDEIHLDDLDIEPPIPYAVNDISGEQIQNQVIQWYFTN